MYKWLIPLASIITLLVTVFGLLLVLAVWFGISIGQLPSEGENTISSSSVIGALMALLMTMVGVLIIRSRPRNAVGWSVLAIGFGLGLSELTLAYALIGVSGIANDLPGFKWVAWISQFCWTLIYLGLMLLLFIYPTGQFLSPRWRWVAYFGVTAIAVGTLLVGAMDPYEIGNVRVPNPVGGFPQGQILPFVNTIFVLFFFTLGAGLISLVLRYMRAQVIERKQIKWLMYTAAVFLVALASSFLTRGDAFQILVNLAALAIPIAIGIAILRYRLLDIDIIIRRTLIYSILTAILALFYLGSVVVLQQILQPLIGQNSDFAIIISTLAIAALFNPLRHRVQNAIDSRFFRRKYNAQKVIERFATTVRDEVELEKLTGELLNVVNETMQPTSVSLWLKKTTDGRQLTTEK
jgi:hypothetical protein